MSTARSGPDLDAVIGAWQRAEFPFAANAYHGQYLPGSAHQDIGTSGVLFTAPHAVAHWRETRMKLADVNTGGLAVAVAEATSSSVLAQCGAAVKDANWYPDAELKTNLRTALAHHTAVIDLHGMRDNYGVDVCVGLGPLPETSTDLSAMVCRALSDAGLRVGVNDPFNAAHPGTVTSFSQSAAVPAVQLELSRTLRTPGTAESRALLTVLTSLVPALTAAPAVTTDAVAALSR